jgi:hypothetical protein
MIIPKKILNERLATECQLEPDLAEWGGSLVKYENYEKR